VYHNLGKSLEWQGQYDQAYSYYLKARENLPPRPHTSLHGVLTNSLGNIHSLINQTIDSAEYYYNASVQIRKEIQDTASLAYVTHDWALLKMGQQEVDTALIMLREARQGFIQTQQLWAAAQAANSFGLAYINKENHDSAIYWNQICIQESEATGNTVALLGALRNLNYSHHIAGQFEKAAEAQDRIIQYQDSVYGNRTNTEIERLEAQLALEAQERTNAVLKQQQALQEAKLARQQLYLFVSGLALFALAGLIYSLSKTRQRQQAFNHTLQVANQEINKQNQDIKDSLAYAQHLQQALLPTPQALSMVLGEFALFYRPLGFVSGDFYWAEELPDGSKLIATIDCTGHGVPGAMLSVLAHSGLQSAVRSGKQEPADLLFHLHTYLRNNLQDQTQDGLAIGLCRIYSDTNRLSFAGAGHNLVAIQRNEMQIMPAIRSSLGSRQWLKNDIIQHEIAGVDHRDTFFLFSDGFQDQFGGPNGRKYYPKQLREWLYQHYHLPMTQLEAQLATEFDSWKGNLDQIDDVLVLGFRPWPRNPKVKQT
ncbi:MAG: SpoIIE family protein phosphatase, partial [Bacteroidota bacterium]